MRHIDFAGTVPATLVGGMNEHTKVEIPFSILSPSDRPDLPDSDRDQIEFDLFDYEVEQIRFNADDLVAALREVVKR